MIELSTGINLQQNAKRTRVLTETGARKRHKAGKYDAIWDLTLVWIVIAAKQYQDSVKALRWRLAAALKASTGWRAELANISRRHGLIVKEEEVWVRYFQGKTTKGGWSRWSILRKAKCREVCTVSILKEYLNKTDKLPTRSIEVPDPDSSETIHDLPLFITTTADKETKEYYAIKKTTVTQLTKEALAYVQDDRGPLASVKGKSRFGAHSYRSAVISFLSTARVELTEVQNRVHSSSATVVNRHYLVPVMSISQRTQETDIDDVLRSGYYGWKYSDIVVDALSSMGWSDVCSGQQYSCLTPAERSRILRERVCRGSVYEQSG